MCIRAELPTTRQTTRRTMYNTRKAWSTLLQLRGRWMSRRKENDHLQCANDAYRDPGECVNFNWSSYIKIEVLRETNTLSISALAHFPTQSAHSESPSNCAKGSSVQSRLVNERTMSLGKPFQATRSTKDWANHDYTTSSYQSGCSVMPVGAFGEAKPQRKAFLVSPTAKLNSLGLDVFE